LPVSGPPAVDSGASVAAVELVRKRAGSRRH
jgi:hypothetical protein